MTRWPDGTVTFLFTDIEGSTHLWETEPDAMRVALARHDALLHGAIGASGGHVFKTVGDAFCAAFATAPDALTAALGIQRVLARETWRTRSPIRVRIALHTGAAETRGRDFFGPPLNRVARLLAAAHGGQTLLSQATCELARDALPPGAALHDLGAHKLKDLARPEQVFEVLHPDLPSGFPPIKSLSTHPNNLPHQVSTFIGREREIGEIEALLAKARLVTLTGAGGSGKTRLSLQVAAEMLEQFSDGAWFVELAGLSDRELVARTVATVLGLQESPGQPIVETIKEHVGTKRLLLVLDNCEHVLDASAAIVDSVIQHCPHVRVLASSREALGLAGEQVYRVPSLSLPDRKRTPTPEALSQFEAVKLFIDRALLVREDFAVTNRNAPALASICFHLDGIPLAIELAAARVRSLSVEEIESRLGQRFQLLTGGSRTALPRQQTLRSLVDWSYDLLSAAEQRLLQRLSAFAGGWTLHAAEAVCSGDDVPEQEIVNLLTSLTDKSLVVAEHAGARTRYRLLETLRQYAREKLEAARGGEALRRRYVEYFLALAKEAEPNLWGPEQAHWFGRLEEEHENLRASLEWSAADTQSVTSLLFCRALQQFWWTHGYLTEGRDWCERILAVSAVDRQSQEWADVVNAAGSLAAHLGDYAHCRKRYLESIAIRRHLGDRRGVARALNNLGVVAHDQGEYEYAQSLHEECLSILRDIGDLHGMASALSNLGNLATEHGDFAKARVLYDESLVISRQLRNSGTIANALLNMGTACYYQGDWSSARTRYRESLAIARELGDRPTIAEAQNALAAVECECGNFAATRAPFVECFGVLAEVSERRVATFALETLAAVVGAVGDPSRAVRMWSAASALRKSTGLPMPKHEIARYDRCIAAARESLADAETFDRAWSEGQAMTYAQAIELAVAVASGLPGPSEASQPSSPLAGESPDP